MEVAIAILLALILVAMVSSNKAAAEGVWKAVRWVGIGTVLLIAWGCIVGYMVWFYETYPSETWGKVTAIVLSIFVPPTLLYINWNTITRSFEKDKRAALKWTAGFVGYLAVIMFLMAFFQEVRQSLPYIGWGILIFLMIFTGIVLTVRSVTLPKGTHVWFNEPDKEEPWLVVEREDEAFREGERALWDELYDTEHTQAQKDTFDREREIRWAAFEQRKLELRAKLDAEKAAKQAADRKLNLRTVFWTAFAFSCFGLIGLIWDYGYAYAMTVPMVKGREWVAACAVVAAMLAIAGLLWSLGEDIYTRRLNRKSLS